MNAALELGAPDATAVQRLLDKQAITEVLYRYCRGVDRCDRAILASAFWPDAEDDHMVFTGSGDKLLDTICDSIREMHTQHRIHNVLIDFEGASRAWCESYVVAYHCMQVGAGREEVIFGGRYLDRFDRRGGEWRIGRRKLVMDYFQRGPAAVDLGVFGSLPVTGGHHPADPLYGYRK